MIKSNVIKGVLCLTYFFSGVHWSQPFVTSMVQLKVIPETKVMNPLVCTTRDGVRNVFRDVQVINCSLYVEGKYG